MKVLICGSRGFKDYKKFWTDLWEIMDNKIGPRVPFKIISGGAKGTDSLAERFAEQHGLQFQKYPADWKTYGNRAGPIRNIQMLKEGQPDLVVAFVSPDSRGTKHMVEIARKAGVEVIEVPVAVE